MCRSLAQGGQRCSTHAQQKLATALTGYGNAIAVGSGNMNRVRRAYDRLVTAEEDYASTPEGKDSLNALLTQDLPPEIRTRITNSLTVGAHLRTRNRIIQRATPALDAGDPLPGVTDTSGTATAVRDAVRHMRENPDLYRTPPTSRDHVIGVATYPTVAAQTAGVRRWEIAVDEAAHAMRRTRFRTLPTPQGLSDEDYNRWNQRTRDEHYRRFAEAAFRLAVISDRLRAARAQTPTA